MFQAVTTAEPICHTFVCVKTMFETSGPVFKASGFGEQELANALCLPREECERLCLETPGCTSIDMHRYLPRCYLNTEDCIGGETKSATGLWDLLEVVETPANVHLTADQDTFVTHTGHVCEHGESSEVTESARACSYYSVIFS